MCRNYAVVKLIWQCSVSSKNCHNFTFIFLSCSISHLYPQCRNFCVGFPLKLTSPATINIYYQWARVYLFYFNASVSNLFSWYHSLNYKTFYFLFNHYQTCCDLFLEKTIILEGKLLIHFSHLKIKVTHNLARGFFLSS